jgi:23S rRNA (cytidine1920-2'-O)/16S rRNA (cytidine1409-2'-O)-methyltransferase
LVRRGLAATRTAAQRAISESRVVVDGIPVAKAATMVDPQTPLRMVTSGQEWASRGALKLLAALRTFAVDVAGRDALDVGASTGGFTDVLLRNGAASVTAVDVGYGQLAWRLREDPRVRVFDRVNFRTAEIAALGAPFGVVAVDVSFISVALLARSLADAGAGGTDYLVLVKPQFEAGRSQVGRGGIVRDPAVHAAAIRSAAGALTRCGLAPRGVCRSPIEGAKGNAEFFLHLQPGEAGALSDESIGRAVGS